MQAYGAFSKQNQYTAIQAEDSEFGLNNNDDTDSINQKIESSYESYHERVLNFNNNLLDTFLYRHNDKFRARVAVTFLILSCGCMLVFFAYTLIYPGYYFTFNTSVVNYMGGVIVSTLAGSGAQGNDDGIGIESTFNHPFGVILSYDDNTLYVTDFGNNAIRSINLITKDVSTLKAEYDWVSPRGMLLSSTGELYVIDSNRVSVINNVEKYFDNDDNSYLNNIHLIAGSTFIGDSNGAGVDARFFFPVAMTFNKYQTLIYITDKYNGKIKTIDINSTDYTVSTLVAGLLEPFGIAIDSLYKNLFVTLATKEIFVYNIYLETYDIIGSKFSIIYVDADVFSVKFLDVSGLTIDQNNNLFIVDDGGHTIRRLDHTKHLVKTVAGRLSKLGNTDGVDSNAKFSSEINLITINNNGTTIYVADSDNNKIREVSLP